MIRVRLRLTGRVQGVGFRYFAQMNAAQFHVTGWVKNMYDGSVTAEAQGTKKQIEDLMEAMKTTKETEVFQNGRTYFSKQQRKQQSGSSRG